MIPHLRRFKDLKTEEEIAMYFVRKTPAAEMVHVKGKELWLPKLGSVCIHSNGCLTRAAAIAEAKRKHNEYSQKLNLKPIYQTLLVK